jgi:glyoxylase-like metal-dependent hydrolase (beta-lactamase superfamily II)
VGTPAACLRLGLLAVTVAYQAMAPAAARDNGGLEPTQLTPGVYALDAPPGPPGPSNAGRTNNTGVLIGSGGVVVVDPGPNRKAGERVVRIIRSLTRRPVVAVILSHAHAENVLAAEVVAGRTGVVIAHARTYALMRDRCSDCLARLTGLTGEAAMTGTNIRLPDQTVGDGYTGRTYGGRKLLLIHTGWGHTAGDLAVLDIATGTLFSGGLTNNQVMPDMHESRMHGWIAALEALEMLAPRRVVPGEGAPGDANLLRDTRVYLADLLERVAATYRQQGSVFELLEDGEMPRYAHWVRYRESQPLNIQHVYAELEKEDFSAR